MAYGNSYHFAELYIPRLLGAIAVLLIGWIIAVLVSNMVRRALDRTKFGVRFAGWVEKDEAHIYNVNKRISQFVYYIILFLTLVGFLQILGLMLVTQPINQFVGQFFLFAPRVIGAIGLIFVAWIVAHIVRFAVRRALGMTGISSKVMGHAGIEPQAKLSVQQAITDTIYWLVYLLFLPGIIGVLGISGLLLPFRSMVNRILVYVPNILAAILILLVGWLLARVVRRLLTNLFFAMGADRLGERAGMSVVLGQSLSNLIGMIGYAFILIPILIAALNALNLTSITAPASHMLDMILATLPRLFGAFLVMLVTYLVAKVVSTLVVNILQGIGFNRFMDRLGIRMNGERTPSDVVGYLIIVASLFFAAIEALHLLGFTFLATLEARFLVFSGHVIVGLVIFGVGLYLARFFSGIVENANVSQSRVFAIITRVSIIVLSAAVALRQTGVANGIINLAFGLTLGSIAVAAAISFGIGGRHVATQWIEEADRKLRKDRFEP